MFPDISDNGRMIMKRKNLIESFAQLLQMLQLDLSLPDRAQPVADLTFMEKRCDLFEPL